MSDPQSIPRPFNKLTGWKRIVLAGLSFGVGIVVARAAVIEILNWYRNRPTAAKNWPEIDNPSQGFKIKLRTEWRDGQVKYNLRVTPHDRSFAVTFDRAVRPTANFTSFTVHLEDSAGFELCKIEMREAVPTEGDDGLVDSVEAEGAAESFECSRSQYLGATKWNVSYRFPKVSAFQAEDVKKTPRTVVDCRRPSMVCSSTFPVQCHTQA